MKYIIKTTTEKVEQGKSSILSNGGSINSNSFEISGVYGTYIFDGEKLVVDIKDKPRLASWSMIESKIKQFFA